MVVLLPSPVTRRYYRGNLHGHSTHSDGVLAPEQVVGCYARLGYDFTCLSEHLWHDTRFAATSVLNSAGFDRDDCLTIVSAELHCPGKRYDSSGLWHILANGLPGDFAMADEQETAPELIQRAIEAGAFVSIAHPEWYAMTSDEVMSLSHAHAVEIYNHSCHINSARSSGAGALDQLLNEEQRPLVIAADDSHARTPDMGGGWVMVAAEQRTAQGIITALKAGQHYSSSGVSLLGLDYDNGTLSLHCSAVNTIRVLGAGHLAIGCCGEKMTRAQFDLRHFSSPWFRVVLSDHAGRHAWSNPYWFETLDRQS